MLERKIKDRIKANIEPSVLGLFDIEILEEQGKKYIHITVARGSEKPYYLKSQGMTPNGCFIRIGSSNEKMDNSLINKLFRERTKNSLKNIIAPRQNLTFTDLKIYYKDKGYEVGDNFEQQLDFFTEDDKYNYVAYLLSDNNTTSIKVAKFAGSDVEDLMENYEYGFCSLIKATYRVLEKIKTENKIYTKVTYPNRIEKEMYDYNAVREIVINAIVHNDWTNEWPPKFEIYSDHLEIFSCGGLPAEISEDDFFNGVSIPRNKELMRVFKDLELVEHLGTGIRKILKKYDKSIYKFLTNFIIVKVKFSENDFDYNVSKDIKFDNNELTAIQQSLITLLLNNPKATQTELATILNVTERTIRNNLKFLINNNYVVRIGSDKKGVWSVVKSE